MQTQAPPTLDDLRDALEGGVPSLVATCSPEGVPNVCYLSQVEYVDAAHVALSFQFFNKTRQNILANPQATAVVLDPLTAEAYELQLRYLRTETDGLVFERMRAKLASIATATGTTAIFRLRGSDIYRVESIEARPGGSAALPKPPQLNRLTALRASSDALCRHAGDLAGLLDTWLDALQRHFGIAHAMVLALDAGQQRFYTLASRGYAQAGIGSEIPLDAGTVGVAAARRTPIRLSDAAAEYAYVRAIRAVALADPRQREQLESQIEFPGLAEPRSQLSVPIAAGERLLGVLHVESLEPMRFGHADEDALLVLARQVGLAMSLLEAEEERSAEALPAPAPAPQGGVALVLRRCGRDNSVFLDGDYLIKGVAGAILWRLVRGYIDEGREHFSNRELRADRSLGLPELSENLEARLVLLTRRLAQRDAGLALERTGRGRFRLVVGRPVRLVDDAETAS